MKVYLQHLTKDQLHYLVRWSLKLGEAAAQELDRRENRGA